MTKYIVPVAVGTTLLAGLVSAALYLVRQYCAVSY